VYDFDRDQVSLGINIHSKDKVSMYKPGGRPKDLAKVETDAQNIEPAAESQEKTASDETKTEKPDTTTVTQTSDETSDESPSSWKDLENMGHFIKNNIFTILKFI